MTTINELFTAQDEYEMLLDRLAQLDKVMKEHTRPVHNIFELLVYVLPGVRNPAAAPHLECAARTPRSSSPSLQQRNPRHTNDRLRALE
jgi:hypothetical protein